MKYPIPMVKTALCEVLGRVPTRETACLQSRRVMEMRHIRVRLMRELSDASMRDVLKACGYTSRQHGHRIVKMPVSEPKLSEARRRALRMLRTWPRYSESERAK